MTATAAKIREGGEMRFPTSEEENELTGIKCGFLWMEAEVTDFSSIIYEEKPEKVCCIKSILVRCEMRKG